MFENNLNPKKAKCSQTKHFSPFKSIQDLYLIAGLIQPVEFCKDEQSQQRHLCLMFKALTQETDFSAHNFNLLLCTHSLLSAPYVFDVSTHYLDLHPHQN